MEVVDTYTPTDITAYTDLIDFYTNPDDSEAIYDEASSLTSFTSVFTLVEDLVIDDVIKLNIGYFIKDHYGLSVEVNTVTFDASIEDNLLIIPFTGIDDEGIASGEDLTINVLDGNLKRFKLYIY